MHVFNRVAAPSTTTDTTPHATTTSSITMFSFLGGGFDVNKLRPHLKMAVQRISIAVNKKTQAIK